MNHQLKHTDIETRDFISDERRFQMKKQNVGGVLVFIYLDNILDVQLRFSKSKMMLLIT